MMDLDTQLKKRTEAEKEEKRTLNEEAEWYRWCNEADIEADIEGLQTDKHFNDERLAK